MEYPSCFVWYLNIQSETIKQWLALTLFMEFSDFWWDSSIQDKKQCGQENCDECENWIQTSSHSYTRIPCTLWLVLSDDVAVFRCTWRSRGWYCDGNAQYRCSEFCCEEFDACHPDWGPGRSTGSGAPDDTNCNALDDQEVVTMKTREWESTCSDTAGECTPCWSRMDCGRASSTKYPCGEIHFTACFKSVEGTLMAAGIVFIGIGRHRRMEWHFRTMIRWVATQYLGEFSDVLMAGRHISANAYPWTCGESQTWWRRSIEWGTPAWACKYYKRLASFTSSWNGPAIFSSGRPCLSFEVVAHKTFHGSFGYFLHESGNGQRWALRNTAQIRKFAKSLCVCNYTQSGWDRLQSHSTKPCSDSSEVLGIEWFARGICMGCPTGATLRSTHMAIEHWTQWLWYQSDWSPPGLWSGSIISPGWSDEPTKHHDKDDIPDSAV